MGEIHTAKGSWNAILFNRSRSIGFTMAEIPADVRDEVERLGGTIRSGLSWSPPEGSIYEWTTEAERPDAVLCVARDDPNYYRVFMHSRDIDLTSFAPAGLNWFD